VAAGLKEALDIGTGNAVASTSQADVFFKNEAIKILMPEKLQTLDKGLRAAPSAKAIFKDALAQTTFSDAKEILREGDTAATDFFRAKTSERLTASFLPIVSSSLAEVGRPSATRTSCAATPPSR